MKYGTLSSNDKKIFRFYYLRESDTQTIRYVGMTANLLSERLRGHLRPRPRASRRSEWIKEVRKRGANIEIVLLEERFCWRRDALAIESDWKRRFKADGVPILP